MQVCCVVECLVYIDSSRLDELRIFMETEAWELCPVRSTFTIHQLRVCDGFFVYIIYYVCHCKIRIYVGVSFFALLTFFSNFLSETHISAENWYTYFILEYFRLYYINTEFQDPNHCLNSYHPMMTHLIWKMMMMKGRT